MTVTTALIYNERLKLAASAINLVAIGLIAVGVTAPLVAASYGALPIGGHGLNEVAPITLFWLLSAFIVHLWAQWVLGRLIG